MLANDRPTHRVAYFRLPIGLLFLYIFFSLLTHPHRTRVSNPQLVPHGERSIGFNRTYLSTFTWKEWCTMYFFGGLSFLTVLFLFENVLAIVYRGPRRLSLTDDYINAEPPKVDAKEALTYDTPITTYERIKILFFTVTGILFFRVVVFIVTTCIGMWVTGIAGKRDRRKHPWWFAFWCHVGYFSSYICLAALGVYKIKLYGKIATRGECKLLLGNHSCGVEVLILFLMGNLPSFVSAKENAKIFLFSGVIRTTHAVLVDRDAAVSRKQTLETIMQRAEDPDGAQLMIFPEGTTGNQRTLFQFKKGAFEAGKPVQMVCIAYPYKHFNPAWTGRITGGNDAWDSILRLCSQLVNHVEVRALPVYYPTEAEKKDAILYAGHCQKMMAAVLRENISDATYKHYEALRAEQKEKQKKLDMQKQL